MKRNLQIWRRAYSTMSPISFIPNENVHRFEGEEMTEEQNRRAIPKRTRFNLPKYYYEMVSPENVYDLLLDPKDNDILVSTLAQGGTLVADPTFKMVSSKGEENVQLQFANYIIKWISLFNNKIVPIQPLPEEIEFEPVNQTKYAILEEKYAAFDKNQLNSIEGIDTFFTSVEGIAADIHDDLSKINLKDAVLFLLDKKEINSDNFETLLSYVKSNIDSVNHVQLMDITNKLIKTLSNSNLSSGLMMLRSFDQFFNEVVVPTSPEIATDLSINTLDNLVGLLSLSANTERAKDILVLMINIHSTLPSSDSFNLFLNAYEATGASKQKTLQDLYLLKPIFFQKTMSPTVFKFLLGVVTHVVELQHLVGLVEKTHKLIPTQYSYLLVDKLGKMQTSSHDTNFVKSLQLSLLVSRLARESQSKLNEQTRNRANEIYTSLGYEIRI